MELNLENPIFVYYLNTKGISKQSIDYQVNILNDYFSNIKNITMWIVPTEKKSHIKCVYDSSGKSLFKKFKKEINDCISRNEDIKPVLRNLKLNDILD